MFIKIQFALFFCMYTFTFSNVFAQQTQTSLNNMIEKKRIYNKNIKDGYSVILYSGEEETAKETYYKFKSEFKNIKVQLTYTSPDWKVTSPVYTSKIEAERILLIIKEKFPMAKAL